VVEAAAAVGMEGVAPAVVVGIQVVAPAVVGIQVAAVVMEPLEPHLQAISEQKSSVAARSRMLSAIPALLRRSQKTPWLFVRSQEQLRANQNTTTTGRSDMLTGTNWRLSLAAAPLPASVAMISRMRAAFDVGARSKRR
jgi:hypothetical protein